jgi:septal ring factor EnvC (AmiA/AmiB activator)
MSDIEKTTDEKIADLVSELALVKERLEKCEKQIKEHETAIKQDIPLQIRNVVPRFQ